MTSRSDRIRMTRARARRQGVTPLISLIIPVYNEEEAVPRFVQVLDALARARGLSLEYVFVNDGSRDDTLAVLVDLQARHASLRILDLSRNFGKEAAMTAGIDAARGDVVIPIDVDLQDPPDLIPVFLDRWREGYDVVLAVRASRTRDGWLKRWTAALFYKLVNRIATSDIPRNTGDYRLMDRSVVDALGQLGERNRFMKGLFSWVGFPTACVAYQRPERSAGTSKFNFWRLWNFALDGVTSFSAQPLKVWTYIGGISALAACLYALFLLIRTLMFGVDVPGYASLMVVLLVSTALNLISNGVLGEYLGRMFIEIKRRPIYIVREEITPDQGLSTGGTVTDWDPNDDTRRHA